MVKYNSVDYLEDFKAWKKWRDSQVCDWCQGGADDLVYDKKKLGYTADVDEITGMLSVYLNGECVAQRQVNYCPMCRKKVGPQDV